MQIKQLYIKIEELISKGKGDISTKLNSIIDCLKTNIEKLKKIKGHVHDVIKEYNAEVKEIKKSENKNDDDEEEQEYDDDDDEEEQEFDDDRVKPKKETKVKMTRIEEIESHKKIIDLLYTDDLQSPSFQEFTRLFKNIKYESNVEREIQVPSLIIEGNRIFDLIND